MCSIQGNIKMLFNKTAISFENDYMSKSCSSHSCWLYWDFHFWNAVVLLIGHPLNNTSDINQGTEIKWSKRAHVGMVMIMKILSQPKFFWNTYGLIWATASTMVPCTFSCTAMSVMNLLRSWLMLSQHFNTNSAILIVQNICFGLDDMSLPEAFSLFLTINMKDPVTFKNLQIAVVSDQSHMHDMHFHFLYQIGSCHVNTLNMLKSEIKIVKFSKFHITLD